MMVRPVLDDLVRRARHLEVFPLVLVPDSHIVPLVDRAFLDAQPISDGAGDEIGAVRPRKEEAGEHDGKVGVPLILPVSSAQTDG